jgi:hypothetical protein
MDDLNNNDYYSTFEEPSLSVNQEFPSKTATNIETISWTTENINKATESINKTTEIINKATEIIKKATEIIKNEQKENCKYSN